ncbi:phage tail tape measure protein [Pseudomonas guariconensis]|uniref:Phage tail tape measure protein n=1 Tax=Pseudomonas guariconensis TaxID=1288410 RepID=A0AAX0VR66_9PSED|nr:phage tail tape measure protein [Pseudomonas guariconensis]MBH3360437.1 phage tail tape measure protein [Pseudomonas guariconensis]PLV12890.1 phage tail tape measure protein [Pseudomonas guariconensis]PLV20961.1 phage tail tape measure protein [Pseudomonas guariconensis]PLV26590.1 phage tail tape measure protein [Pseudomonas guariconensis]
MTTIAELGIRIDSGDAVDAASDLDRLVDAGGRAEKAAAGVEQSARKAGQALKEQAGDLSSLLGEIDPTVKALGRLDDLEKRLSQQRKIGNLDPATFSDYRSKIQLSRDELSRFDEALGRTGVSAKQTAAAMRMLPAQFSDIFVSLQGGQAPLTVFLQQGAQIKDSFGGIGAAAKAMGSYLLGLVTPFSAAAAGAAALGYAWYKGAEEADEYNKALILTGRSAGLTADQLSSMARQIGSTVGSTGAAAAALAGIAGGGKIAGESFQQVAQAAISMEVATGKAVADTVAEFAKLADDPVKASASLNQQYHYLTASVYDQITALEQQGRHADAVKLATDAFADAINDRTPKIIENLSFWERGYNAVAKAADRLKDIGRPNIDDDIARMEANLASAKRGEVGYFQDQQKMVEFYTDELQFLKDKKAAQEENAKYDKEQADSEERTLQAMTKADALEKAAWTNSRKRAEALKEYERALDIIRQKNPSDSRLAPDTIATVKANIAEQYKDPATRNGPAYREDAGTKALDQARQQYSVLQQQYGLIGAQVGEMQKLGEAGQALVRWEQQLADIKDKKVLTADQKSLLANQQQITTQLTKNAELEKEMQLRKVATEEAQKLSAFQANLNSQLQRASVVLESNLAGMGMGDVSRQRMQERLNIEQQYQQQMDNLEQQHNEGRISQGLYEKETDALRKALDERLAMQTKYYEDVDAAQADWSLGARSAFASYLEQARDVAGQTRTLFSNAFMSMEDAVANFAITGKLSFSDFTKSVLADMARIATRQAITGIAGSLFGSAIGGFFGGGGSAVGKGTMTGFSETISDVRVNAKGGVYDSPSLSHFSNQVHSTPQFFAFAKGAGVFGEAGPEAIMPLTRAPDGNLGVRALGRAAGASSAGAEQKTEITININREGGGDVSADTAMGQRLAPQFLELIRAEIAANERKTLSPSGGATWRAIQGRR